MTDTTATAPARATSATTWNRQTGMAMVALLVLVGLGDFLLYGSEPGLNLGLFAVALVAAVVALFPRVVRGPGALLVVIALAGVAPLFESASPLAVLIAQVGITLLVLFARGILPAPENWPGAFTRFSVLAPFRLVSDFLRLTGEAADRKTGGQLARGVVVWIVPAACAAVFLLLFAAANPLVDAALRAIRIDELLRFLNPGRIALWLFLAALAWPFLVPRLLPWTARPEIHGPRVPRVESLIFGRAAIVNSLVLFNALFALQTVMDLLFLWGGVRLPDGMTFAGYAHRGAYPLIVTALLAAAFVLAAMRKGGPGEASTLIRNLVYLWIAQNVWLVISSLLRLSLYVEVYHLTELRIAAGMWMALVAVGLVLIVLRIAMDKSNKWLVSVNLVAATVTLWGFTLLDLPSIISTYNVRHSQEIAGNGQQPIDLYYMQRLGPGTVPALDEFLRTARHASADRLTAVALTREALAEQVLEQDPNATAPRLVETEWRSWSWRQHRIQTYLLAHPIAPDAGQR